MKLEASSPLGPYGIRYLGTLSIFLSRSLPNEYLRLAFNHALENVKLRHFMERDNLGVFMCAIAITNELPTMIIGIVDDVENRLCALKASARD